MKSAAELIADPGYLAAKSLHEDALEEARAAYDKWRELSSIRDDTGKAANNVLLDATSLAGHVIRHVKTGKRLMVKGARPAGLWTKEAAIELHGIVLTKTGKLSQAYGNRAEFFVRSGEEIVDEGNFEGAQS